MSKVESVVSCQFKCSNSGRLCGPRPALFWDPTFYACEGRAGSSSPESEEPLEEEALPRGPSNLPKTSNLKHALSIKYLISLKVINSDCVL